MYIGEIITADCANGQGMRVSVFVSGCTNHCEGCFQPQTWDFRYGEPYTKDIEDELIEELANTYYDGLTILGGEPFEPSNQEELIKLIRRVKKELPQRTIWMYTGFTYDKDLVPGGKLYTPVTDEILDSIDVLVDGKFMLERKNLRLHFRGSENQRILDMRKTRETGTRERPVSGLRRYRMKKKEVMKIARYEASCIIEAIRSRKRAYDSVFYEMDESITGNPDTYVTISWKKPDEKCKSDHLYIDYRDGSGTIQSAVVGAWKDSVDKEELVNTVANMIRLIEAHEKEVAA